MKYEEEKKNSNPSFLSTENANFIQSKQENYLKKMPQ